VLPKTASGDICVREEVEREKRGKNFVCPRLTVV
jgi:hypothetical protein